MTCDTDFYRGDDLVDFLTVNRPTNTDDIDILKCAIQIGDETILIDNPEFPFQLSLEREKSINLSHATNIYMAIYFNAYINGVQKLIKRTCDGEVTVHVAGEVVGDYI